MVKPIMAKLKNNIRNFICQKLEQGISKENIIDQIILEYSLSKEDATKFVNSISEPMQFKFPKFWAVKNDNYGNQRISIIQYNFCQFLNKELGLSLYFGDERSSVFRLVLDKNGILQECTSEMLKKRLIKYIEKELPEYLDEIHRNSLCEALMKHTVLFKDIFLEFLEHSEFQIMKDEKDKAFFYFKNTVVEVTKSWVKTVKYNDEGKVWISQVNDFNFFRKENEDAVFKDFCFKLSGENEGKFNSLRSIIGYAIHKYKDPSNAKALIICEELEDSNKGGGSGKSILIKAISKIVDGMTLDGELFDPKQPFAMQRYRLGQSFIAVEDAAKNMSLKNFKSLITEGLTIDKKNKDQLYLPYKDAPKWFFTTNYNIGGIANYEKRRVIKFGVEPFFNIKNKPDQFYKHYFFEDWDKTEWNKFFNFMIDCCQYYLENGIVELPSEILNKKALSNSYGKEFSEFINDWYERKEKISAKELYNEFLNETEQISRDYNFKRFKYGLEAAIELLKLDFSLQKNKHDKNKLMVVPGGGELNFSSPINSLNDSKTDPDMKLNYGDNDEEPF